MEYVLIIHDVEDYAAWKVIFDEAASLRAQAGELSYQVLKYQNQANRIVHFSKWWFARKGARFF